MFNTLTRGKSEYESPELTTERFAEQDVLDTSGGDNFIGGDDGADKTWGGLV